MKNLNIYSKDIDVNSSIEDYIQKRIDSLDKLFKGQNFKEIKADYRIGKVSNSKHSGDKYFAEVNISTPKKNYGARSENDDLYEAIDSLREELFNKISGFKDKKRTLFRKGAVAAKKILKGLKK